MVTVLADHLVGQSGRGEPQRTNNFYIEFSTFVPATKLYVSGVSFPTYQAEVGQIRQGNLFKNYVSGSSYGDIQLTIYDIIDPRTSTELDDWWTAIVGSTREDVSPPEQYKDEAELAWVDGCGGNSRAWRLIGCFPREIAFGEGNMSAVAPVEVRITLAVDLIEPVS